MVFYHGGIEPSFAYDDLSVLRPSEKQGNKYAGFYMYGEENFEGAIRYANQENVLKNTTTKGIGRITLDDDIKIHQAEPFTITRITPEEIKALQEQGYDVISGKMMGKTEHVLINKNKIKTIDFLSLEDLESPTRIYTRESTHINQLSEVPNSKTTVLPIKKLTSKEAFIKYGPNDDRFFTSQGLDPVQQRKKIEELNAPRNKNTINNDVNGDESFIDSDIEDKKPESITNTQNITEQSTKETVEETIEQSAKNTVEETTEETITQSTKNISKTLPKKSLGGKGKLAIGLAIAGAVIGVAATDRPSNKKEKQSKPHNLPRSTNSEEFDNQYAQQMAADISSYKYGKHMTGFVNF